MNNYLKIGLISLAILLLGFVSCRNDNENEMDFSVSPRSQDCDQSLSFSKSVYTLASFAEDENLLTNTEKMMRVPKGDYFEQRICKRRDGTVYTEIESKPEMAKNPEFLENTIAPRTPLKWRSTNDNGNVNVYDEDNQLIDSYATTAIQADDISLFYKVELMNKDDYELFVNGLKDQMQVNELPNNKFKVTTLHVGGRTETIFDREFQNKIAIISYDSQGTLKNKTSYFYKIENNFVVITNEINESYKKSMDSNKLMTLLTLTEYNIQ